MYPGRSILAAPLETSLVHRGRAHLPGVRRRGRVCAGELGASLAVVPDPSALFTALPCPALALSRDGAVVAWNTAAERAFGWARGDVLGRPAPLFPAASLPGVVVALRRVLDGGRDEELAVPCIDRGGAARTLRLRATGVDGAVLLVATGDASGAEDLDDAHRLQAVLDAIPEPIFFKDAAGAYLGFNSAFERYLGTPRERLLGRSVFDVAPRDLAEVYRAADVALFQTGGTQVYETRVQWADGSRREVVFHKAVLRDATGATVGLAGAMHDVTEQREAERSLRTALDAARSSEASFRQLVESVPDLVVIHEGGRVVYANPALREVLQLSSEEVEGASLSDWIHPDDFAAVSPFVEGGVPMPAWRAPPPRTGRKLRDGRVPGHLDRDGGPAGARRHRARSHRAHPGAGAARARAAARRDRHARGRRRARAQQPAHLRPLERRARRGRAATAARRPDGRGRVGRVDPRARRRARGRGADARHRARPADDGARRRLRHRIGRRPQAPRVRGEPRVERGAAARAARLGRRPTCRPCAGARGGSARCS